MATANIARVTRLAMSEVRSAIISAIGGIMDIMYTSSLLLMTEYGMSTAAIQLR